MRDSPVNLNASSSLNRSALIAQFPIPPTSSLQQQPPPTKEIESAKPTARKRRFKQLRRAMSLTHIRQKPTPPDTAPPTPTVPNQVPSSVGVKSLDSLAHWQLPDPTAPPASLDGKLIGWPSSLLPNHSSATSYQQPLDQLSPPSSIPSESDILPRDSLISDGIERLSSPSVSPIQSFDTLYPPSIYDSIDLSDSNVLQKNANGKVIAATVEGLVAYITSPDCLDYDVLSDFFLMYRKFMEPSKLLGLLCARFEWGLIKGAVVRPPDNEGKIPVQRKLTLGMVRVRTFAALRHWLLNYYADDFAPSPSLRSQYVKAINSFGRDNRVNASVRDTKIITELKRCWKRVSTIYWDDQAEGGGPEGEITDQHGDNSWSRNRVPSLIFRATKKREEMLRGVSTSQSQPDLRKGFLESGRTGTVNSNRPTFGRGHARIHSTSTIHARPQSHFGHRRNLSTEARIMYSKNSNPMSYQSFARGDGRDEWPPVIVRAELIITSPKTNSPLPFLRHPKKRFFKSKKKRLAVEGNSIPKSPTKSPTGLSCIGQLSDDEVGGSRRTRRSHSVSTTEPAKDRVDFLAAGMWASLINATGGESQVNLPQAEELGEYLVQGYTHPMTIDNERALSIAASSTGKAMDRVVVGLDATFASSESQALETTLSMSEIERRLESIRPVSENPDSFPQIETDLYFSEQFKINPTPPPMMDPPEPGLRRQPGGNLRQAETIGQLRPRPETLISVNSSTSSFSIALFDGTSNLAIPSVSNESRSRQSLLDIPNENQQSYSPAHRMSGLEMDFTQFQMPEDIESSDDENCDPAAAVEKALLKLEGKYVRKNRRRRSDEYERKDNSDFYEIAFNSTDLNGQSFQESVHSESPPGSIMVERNEETRWGRRHKHVVDGQECDTPIRHGPFTPSSLLEYMDSPVNTDKSSQDGDSIQDVQDVYIPVLTVESALAELERDRLEALGPRLPIGPRLPSGSPPKPPESYHRSLASHLPFILQYDSSLLARQFTLIEKDICAEIDWAELIEPTWMERNGELVNVRDWKRFVYCDEGDCGLDTVMARFNLVHPTDSSKIIVDGWMDDF